MVFSFANERCFQDFRRACLLPRPSHARHQLQSIFAALQSSLSSYLLDSLSHVSFEHNANGSLDPTFCAAAADTTSLLLDWLTFSTNAHHQDFAHIWVDVPVHLQEYATNRLQDIFHLCDPPPVSSNRTLPPLQGPVIHSAFSLIALRDHFLRCSPPCYPLAHAFASPVQGWTDSDATTLLSPLVDLDSLPIPIEVDVGTTTYTIWAAGHVLLALHSSAPLSRSSDPPPPTSNFSPPDVIWPYWDRGIPEFHASTLPRCISAWKSILGPFLGQAARTILESGFVIPRRPHEVARPFLAKNHTSVEKAPALIDRIIAKYIITGTVEQIPRGCRPPMVTHPLGLVEKKSVDEPWRIIHDNRDDNLTILDWPSNLRSMAASAFLFSPRCWVFTIDLKAAYHTVPLRGCGGPLRLTGRSLPNGEPEWIIGCSVRDGTCTGGCDKDRLGFFWKGAFYRMNAPPFGMKVSGNGLEVLTSAFLRKWKRKGIRFIIWVDDVAIIIPSIHCPHTSPAAPSSCSDLTDLDTPCPGAPACTACQTGFERASNLRAAFLADIKALGWLTNEKDSGPPAQRGEFIGVAFDSILGTFHLTDEQAASLIRRCEKLRRLGPSTPRKLAKLRGKLIWYSPCIHHAPIIAKPLSNWIGGPETPAAWDAVRPLSPPVLAAIDFLIQHLPALSLRARPIWPCRPMQLYARWLTQQPGSTDPNSFFSVIGVAYVDASVHGYGIAWQALPDDPPTILASPPHPADPWDEQAHREASAYKRAAIFIASLGLHGRAIIVSDCLPVTAAMSKGSPSEVLQAAAEDVVTIALEADLLFEPLWVPGKELVDMGVDGLSRDAILDMHDMSLAPRFFQLARDLAHQHFQDFFTVDFFASTASAVCPRYWSQFPDPDAEGTDSLSAPSWCGSACECGSAHFDVAWLFPPMPLLKQTLAKIKNDGCRGVLLAPVTPGADWWPILEEATIDRRLLPRCTDLFLPRHKDAVSYSGSNFQWALFALSYGPAASTMPDACPLFRQAPLVAKPSATLHAQVTRALHLNTPIANLAPPS